MAEARQGHAQGTFMISAKETELVSMLLTPASKLGTGRISNSP